MRKKLNISEKLRKMSEATLGKGLPILRRRRAKEGVSETGRLRSIKDLAIPSSELRDVLSKEVVCDPTESRNLVQLLSLKKKPEIEVKWTVFRDPDRKEFKWFKDRGGSPTKEDPSILALKFDGGTVLASHTGRYTFTMGSYNLGVEELTRIFETGLNHARKYDLGTLVVREEKREEVPEVIPDIRGEIKEKDRKIKELEDEISSLKKERDKALSESTKKISALEAKVKEFKEELRKREEITPEVPKVEELKPLQEEIDILRKIIEEREAPSPESTEEILALEAKVKEFEEELRKKEEIISAKTSEIKKLKSLKKEVDPLRKSLKEKEAMLSESTKKISALEAKVKEYEEELRKKEKDISSLKKKLNQIKKEKNKHELLDQRVYPLVLDSINRKLKLATIEKRAATKLLDQLAEQALQISEKEYKIKERKYADRVETISQNLAELKELKKEIVSTSEVVRP
jgi:peptidoglycan hydrolase CwlO-like protein